MIEMKNKTQISALVIGGSGHGKSEFILSFINKKDRELLLASGDGQTTRTSVEYCINCEEETTLQIKVDLKSKKLFVDDRKEIAKELLGKKPDNMYSYNNFKRALINDDAFFNVKEFGEETSNYVEELYKEKFNEKFFQLNKEYDDTEDNNKEGFEFEDKYLEEFFEAVYEKCKETILQKYNIKQLKNISDIGKDNIALFLKVDENGFSYSALVKKIIITTNIATYYDNLFDKYNIKSIKFIDTYGLDHAKVATVEVIKKRYQQLLNKEYQDVKTVFYIRNVKDSTSASDLNQNIPLLFDIAPTVMPYIIFTKIDELEKEFQQSKAYKEIEKCKDSIGAALHEQGVNAELIENRINYILDTRIGYCSYVGKEGDKDYSQYIYKNSQQIEKIISCIKYNKHLGNKYIQINQMKVENFKSILNVDYIFTEESNFDFLQTYYPSRTKWALSDRLKRDILGFNGTTTKSTCWSDLIQEAVNNRFKKIKELDILKEYSVDKEERNTLLEVLLESANSIYKCICTGEKILDERSCKICSECQFKKDCIREMIYKEKGKTILNENKYESKSKWLNEIYKFSNMSNETKACIQDKIKSMFETRFINDCRVHNAKMLSKKLTDNNSRNNFNEDLKKYYNCFDSDLTDEERIEFEQMINLYKIKS